MTTPSERLMPISDELRKAADIEAETPITVGAVKSAALTESEVEAFRELASKATPGPWYKAWASVNDESIEEQVMMPFDTSEHGVMNGYIVCSKSVFAATPEQVVADYDLKFIVAARNIADRLAAEWEEMREWKRLQSDLYFLAIKTIADTRDQLAAAKARIEELEDELKYAQQIVTDTEKDRDSVHTKLAAAKARIEELEHLFRVSDKVNREALQADNRVIQSVADERDQLRQQLAERDAEIANLKYGLRCSEGWSD